MIPVRSKSLSLLPGLFSAFMLALLCLAWAGTASAAGNATDGEFTAPPGLEEWRDWVLHGYEQELCPSPYNTPQVHICAFATLLSLSVNQDGGGFSMTWNVLADEAAALPYVPGGSGTSLAWPELVYVDGEPAPVIDMGGIPAVLLGPGKHEVSGDLSWSVVPEYIQLPANAAILELTRNGKLEPFPDLAPGGRLNLSRTRVEEARPDDSLDVSVFRLVRDSLPMEITTHIRLDVSGKARLIVLENILPSLENTRIVPLEVVSPAPLSFGPDGSLNVQAGPGRWEIRVKVRLEGPVATLGPALCPYGREFWSFQAENGLRVVEMSGAPGVDPQTTDIPQDWKSLPAYLIDPGAVLSLEEMHRGAPKDAPDDLNLYRALWLDFDGKGLTVQDSITGQAREGWTLVMLAPGRLGRVNLFGQDQPVVLLGENGLPGVELRSGDLALTAESRYEDFGSTLPSVGWDRDFTTLTARLNLPPGWRLLTATGVDQARDTWVSRWNLLDIFLTLLISLAIFRLKHPLLGLAALVFFALSWHEPGAPRNTWIALLGFMALLRLFATTEPLKEWVFTRRLLLWGYWASVVVIILVCVPFIYNQIQNGLYPQLERLPYQSGPVFMNDSIRGQANAPYAPGDGGYYSQSKKAVSEDMLYEEMPQVQDMDNVGTFADKGALNEKRVSSQNLMYDPEALVQTGPGLPDWDWRSVDLVWNGPVERGQELKLWLIPPLANLLIALGRVVLLVLVLLPLLDMRVQFRSLRKSGVLAPVAGVLLVLFSLAAGATQARAEYPPDNLLQEYRARLLEKAPCHPFCVSSPNVFIMTEGDRLGLSISVHATAEVLVPLPVLSERWQPDGIFIDEVPAKQLFREDDGLWVKVEPGVHRVIMEGPLPKGDSFRISFPLAPKNAGAETPGWSVQGLGPDGDLEGSLQFSREKNGQEDAETEVIETYRVPPFLHVTRRLILGLTWEVETTVSRITPQGEPVMTEIPLLPGESVLTDGVEVKDGKALVNLSPSGQAMSWLSRLEPSDLIQLVAPEGVEWVETWILEASAIWDLDIQGIPESETVDGAGQWRPLWRPWPGESVSIAPTRPSPSPGESMTIDSVTLAMSPGARLDENTLTLSIRASKGGRHTLTLPEGAELAGLSMDGKDLPLTGNAPGEVGFSVTPGTQELRITWRQARDSSLLVTAPAVDLGHAAVNAEVTYEMGRDRWILFTWNGPAMGPAVRFWVYLAAGLVMAFVLGFIPWTPLKHRHWFLLVIGLTQIHPFGGMLAVAWLIALGLRKTLPGPKHWLIYNLMQVALAGLAAVGLLCLYYAVEKGLLGLPGMQVAGNGSYGSTLVWTADRIAGALPRPTVLSLPIFAYRIVMLLWSLWLALALLKWLRWGWDCLIHEALWLKPELPSWLGGKDDGEKTEEKDKKEEKKKE